VQLSVTTHERLKNQAAISGYSVPVNVSMAAIQARRLLDQDLPQLLRRYDYAAAEQAVQRIALLPDQDAATRSMLRRLQDLLVVLDAWDRFDHHRAVQVLQGLGERNLDQNLLFPLKRVIGSRRLLDVEAEEQKWPQMRGHGLEAVEDLLLNAERRASQDRFDDAVGRLYRAMELAAQLPLKISFDIETASLDLAKLPDSLRESYALKQEQNGGEPLKIALKSAFDLLAELEHPIGHCWVEKRSQLLNSLNVRNASLFAHGFRSIDYATWCSFRDVVAGFLQRVIALAQAERQSPLLQQLPCRPDQFCSY
jgi:CRISPR-associated protein (TIGR02710 family)